MNSKKMFLLGVSLISGVLAYSLHFYWIPGIEKEFVFSSGFFGGFFLLIFRVLLYVFFSTFLVLLTKAVVNLKPMDPRGNKGLMTGMMMGFWICWVSSLIIGFFVLLLEASALPGKTWSLELIILLKVIFFFSLASGFIIGLKNELTTFPKKSKEK
ncbi:hypothetical protein GW931_03740 [archaeon]|nr:hypothetical protein [archaeon]PJC45690.1 MAG: hypothetical protein CO037_00160 [Candidatus Pacearchaeota archaeon CG_4_9_14_0_2_um_filter_30_8]